MFRKILVALDGTPQSAAALPLARTVARATGGVLHLLRVTSSSHYEVRQANSYLELIATELGEDDMDVAYHVVSGETAKEIVKVARECDVDLVVMSTHAATNSSILALTSVARAVLTSSPAPVLLLHPGGKRISKLRTIVVPVDGSPGGSLAVAAARALAASTGSRMVLLDVVVPIQAEAVGALPGMTIGGYIDPRWEEQSVSSAQNYVHELQATLTSAGVECDAHVIRGEVRDEILRCVEQVAADMVIMSSHALNWPERAYTESIADRVLSEGRVPVMFVRREPPDGAKPS